MWDAFVWYCIFCITTGITCVFYFWRPLIKKAKEAGLETHLVNSPLRGTFVYFCLATIAAPLMFLILFSSGMSQSYTDGLEKIITDPDE